MKIHEEIKRFTCIETELTYDIRIDAGLDCVHIDEHFSLLIWSVNHSDWKLWKGSVQYLQA
jgi:hypothetical protein